MLQFYVIGINLFRAGEKIFLMAQPRAWNELA